MARLSRWWHQVRSWWRTGHVTVKAAIIEALVTVFLGAFLASIPSIYGSLTGPPPNSKLTDLMDQEVTAASTHDENQRVKILRRIYDPHAVVADAACSSGLPDVRQGINEIIDRYQLLPNIVTYHVNVTITWNPASWNTTKATATADTVGVLSSTTQDGTETRQFISGLEQWTFSKNGGQWVITLFVYNLCMPSALSSSSHGSQQLCINTYQQPSSGPLRLLGLAYGPFHTGQDPNSSVFPSQQEIESDMPTLASLTNYIRIYSSTGPAQAIVQAAEAAHIKVALGISLGPDPVANEVEITAGEHLASNKAVQTLIVGNEVLHRGDLSAEELDAYLQRVRSEVPSSVQITMADTYDQWLAHPELANDVNVITVHIYPFWQGVSIACAIPTLDKIYNSVKAAFPKKPIWIGETGWPSGASPPTGNIPGSSTGSSGSGQGGAIPSAVNQLLYLRAFTHWAQQNKVPQYFYFDAFDEDWKTQEGAVGSHWGLYQQDGQVKPSLSGLIPEADPTTLRERSYRDIYVGGVESGFDLGIDTSEHQFGWLTVQNDASLQLNYPSNQQWGTMFVTVGKASPPGERHSFDLSAYRSLIFDMHATVDGQCVFIGIKDSKQRDDGSETTKQECLSTHWVTYRIPLNQFTNADQMHLYVVFEIIFKGTSSISVDVRNIHYSPT